MKTLLALATLAFTLTAVAEDHAAPKPISTHLLRVLLHVQGAARALDYTDVVKVHCCNAQSISFETYDGFIVAHQGPYTLIGPKNELHHGKGVLAGTHFYDPK
jgi:hypothetical protein